MGRKNHRKLEHIPKIRKRTLIHPKRMDIWYASLPLDRRTSVQGGNRPVVIVSNDICNEKSTAVTVLPVTSRLKHPEMPTHVILVGLMDEPSMVLAEQIMTVDKSCLDRKIGECGRLKGEIERALMEQIGIAGCLEGQQKGEENENNNL